MKSKLAKAMGHRYPVTTLNYLSTYDPPGKVKSGPKFNLTMAHNAEDIPVKKTETSSSYKSTEALTEEVNNEQ